MKTNRVNVFANRKASKEFYRILMSMNVDEGARFSKAVRDLFQKKTISEEGEFNSFKIEMSDLKVLAYEK